jgi:hypothetical protein
MAGTSTRHAQLQEHRRLIDEQRIHLRRQQRQIDWQVWRTADVQPNSTACNPPSQTHIIQETLT